MKAFWGGMVFLTAFISGCKVDTREDGKSTAEATCYASCPVYESGDFNKRSYRSCAPTWQLCQIPSTRNHDNSCCTQCGADGYCASGKNETPDDKGNCQNKVTCPVPGPEYLLCCETGFDQTRCQCNGFPADATVDAMVQGTNTIPCKTKAECESYKNNPATVTTHEIGSQQVGTGGKSYEIVKTNASVRKYQITWNNGKCGGSSDKIKLVTTEPGYSSTFENMMCNDLDQKFVCDVANDPDCDKVKSPNDKCPNQAEDKDGFKDDDGCPEADNDDDGACDPGDEIQKHIGDYSCKGKDVCPDDPCTDEGSDKRCSDLSHRYYGCSANRIPFSIKDLATSISLDFKSNGTANAAKAKFLLFGDVTTPILPPDFGATGTEKEAYRTVIAKLAPTKAKSTDKDGKDIFFDDLAVVKWTITAVTAFAPAATLSPATSKIGEAVTIQFDHGPGFAPTVPYEYKISAFIENSKDLAPALPTPITVPQSLKQNDLDLCVEKSIFTAPAPPITTYGVCENSSTFKVTYKFDTETPLTINSSKEVMVLPGIPVKIEFLPNTTAAWSKTAGDWKNSFDLDDATTPKTDQKAVYFQIPTTATLPASATVTAKSGGVDYSITLKSRLLKSGVDDGDDIKILQDILRHLGLSTTPPPNAGVAGTAVVTSGTFDADFKVAVVAFQSSAELSADGAAGQGTYTKTAAQMTDYYNALQLYTGSPKIGPSHADFSTWVIGGGDELKTTFTDAIASSIDASVKQSDVLKAWIKQESGPYGHWGFNIEYRITLGTADAFGSIGFSQIQNKFKYGEGSVNTKFQSLNLYDPEIGVKGFAIWSNLFGFKSAFVGTNPVYKVTLAQGTTYPRLKTLDNTYADTYGDLLAKGITAYNRGQNWTELKNMTWPYILQTYQPPAPANDKDLKGVEYSLLIRKSAGYDLSARKWKWIDKSGDVEFEFDYSEKEWLDGTTWDAKRAASVPPPKP